MDKEISVFDNVVYQLHLTEVHRLREAGVYVGEESETGGRYASLVGVKSGDGEPAIYNFSGEFEQIVADVLNILAARIAFDNRLKGFWPDGTDPKDSLKMALYPKTKGRNPAEALDLTHSELSEALEAIRSSPTGGFEVVDDKLPHRSGFATELVDAIIRCLDQLGGYDLDGGTILIEKLERNRRRPYKHGRQF